MKRLWFLFILFVFCGISIFSDNDKQEEIDFLLFMPNSSNQFVNEEQALVQLDNLARYLLNKKPASGQIIIYGYAAFAPNDIEPVDLSRERAVFVINELRKRGVSKDFFSDPVGHGSVYLWGNNSGEDDRKPNRRVRILMGGESPTPITPEIVNAEIENEIPEDIQEEALVVAIVPVDTREKPDFKFPWWILLILPLLLILFLLLKNKPRKTAQQSVTANVYAPPPEPEPLPEPVKIYEPEHIYKHESASVPEKTEIKINLDDEIRFRAYELSERRNWHGDYREQDWYDAMREITAMYIYNGYAVCFEGGYWWAVK